RFSVGNGKQAKNERSSIHRRPPVTRALQAPFVIYISSRSARPCRRNIEAAALLSDLRAIGSEAQAGELMAGTLGAVVTGNGVSYTLSNNHVLANENALPPGTPIFQPGLLDSGNAATDRIATLARFVPLETDTPNRVDCALATILDATTVRPGILPKIGRLTSAEPIEAGEGMQVEKTGGATG